MRTNRNVTHQKPIKIHLPGFILDGELGLGDVVKKATSSMGIKACGSCYQRASIFNRWMLFVGRHK
jgi:hypothetical protein